MITCPTCGASEMHPDGMHLLIKAYKVCDRLGRWGSQCLVCAGYYNIKLEVTSNAFNSKKGWWWE
jgi:hypothetical protein